MKTRPAKILATLFAVLTWCHATNAQILVGIIQNDVTPVTFTDDQNNTVTLRMPYGLSTSYGQAALFGQGSLRPNFHKYSHRVSVYEDILRKASTGPEISSQSSLLYADRLLNKIGVAAGDVSKIKLGLQTIAYSGTVIAETIPVAQVHTIVDKLYAAGTSLPGQF